MIDVGDYIEWARVVARRYRGRGLDAEDLEGEAMVGLIKACERFDPDAGTRFERYAEWWIGREIRLALAATRPIKIPYHRLCEARAYRAGRRPDLTPRRRELLADALHALDLRRAGDADVVEDLVDHFDPQAESLDRALEVLSRIAPARSEVIQIRLGLDGQDPLPFARIDARLGRNTGWSFNQYRKGIRDLKAMHELHQLIRTPA